MDQHPVVERLVSPGRALAIVLVVACAGDQGTATDGGEGEGSTGSSASGADEGTSAEGGEGGSDPSGDGGGSTTATSEGGSGTTESSSGNTGGTTTSTTSSGGDGTGNDTGAGDSGGDVTGETGTGGEGTPGCGSAVTPGPRTHTIEVAGVERTYLVVAPASLDGDVAAPVLLGFHGGSGTSEYASQTYGLTGDEPVVYVYPQAPYWEEAGGVAWNVDPTGVDFPYFDAMLEDLGQNYCIDTARVFAAGQSNGGFFVNALACYRPHALRAIASAAGGGPPGECTISTMAAMIVHGTNDQTVLPSSGEYSREYWLASNGCSGASSTPTDPAPCVAYAGCAEPVLWCEHPGGHDWPQFAGAAIRGFFLGL